MTHVTQNSLTCTRRALSNRALSHSRVDHEYLPMDVFIDPRTLKQRSQVSSSRTR